MATAKDIKQLQSWGKEDKVVSRMMAKGIQPDMFLTGSFWPSGANWAWQIGIVQIGIKHYELLTRFGGVEGGREIYMAKLNAQTLGRMY